MKNKRGNILTENIIFLILNLVFITILLVFVFTKLGSGAILEEKYAKEIALTLDSSVPGMFIELSMEDAFEEAEKNNMALDEIISINENIVTVKLNPDGRGYSYSFFNDVDVEEEFIQTTNERRYDLKIN